MIEARRVTKRFGSFPAVNEVSLSVGAGEFVTLLGPSGCGKTTLLRVLAGFERPDEGSVILDGEDITALPPYRRNLNQVFQSYALFPHLSVEDNVGFGLRMRGMAGAERRRRVGGALEAVALTGLEGRKPDQLSGGQRQRVALARALVCEPRVLLLDEPLSALDAKLRRAMQLELKSLQRRLALSFIFVTHDQQEAMVLSDRIAVMNAGRIEQVGSPEDVYLRPATAFAADFIGQANLLRLTVVARTGSAARVRFAQGAEIELTLPGGAAPSGEILVSVRPEKMRLSQPPGRPGLSFSARLEARVFEGPAERLILALPGGERLQVLVTHGSGGTPVRTGEWVPVFVDPEDITALP